MWAVAPKEKKYVDMCFWQYFHGVHLYHRTVSQGGEEQERNKLGLTSHTPLMITLY
jgi:hypothetical protein